jgi:hypothetical protein
LKAIHELPPCPDHISEPKYTYMMFSDVFCDVSAHPCTELFESCNPGFLLQGVWV